jgi:hypothetical protein
MPAPLDNQNAVKDESERATAFIHAKVAPSDKGAFMAAAKEWAKVNNITDKRGPFTMWMLSVLRAAVPQHIKDMISKPKQ